MSTTSGPDVLEVRFSRHDQTVVLHLAGDLDVATAPVLRQALVGIIEDQGNLAVELDLREMTFVDSTGLSVLIGALRRLREKGGHLSLANLRPQTRKVFDIVGLSTIFDMGPGRSGPIQIGDGMVEASDSEPVVQGLGQEIVFPRRNPTPARKPSLNVGQ